MRTAATTKVTRASTKRTDRLLPWPPAAPGADARGGTARGRGTRRRCPASGGRQIPTVYLGAPAGPPEAEIPGPRLPGAAATRTYTGRRRDTPLERRPADQGGHVSDESGFTTTMRGYNRDEVDRAMQELRRELIKANSSLAEAQREVKRLSARVDEL